LFCGCCFFVSLREGEGEASRFLGTPRYTTPCQAGRQAGCVPSVGVRRDTKRSVRLLCTSSLQRKSLFTPSLSHIPGFIFPHLLLPDCSFIHSGVCVPLCTLFCLGGGALGAIIPGIMFTLFLLLWLNVVLTSYYTCRDRKGREGLRRTRKKVTGQNTAFAMDQVKKRNLLRNPIKERLYISYYI